MSWFIEAFGKDYLRLYAHRDEQEAARQVAFAEKYLKPGSSILDIACGAGRHIAEFIRKNHSVVGIDLSAHLLSQAKNLAVARADMRQLPFRDAQFDLLSNFFTSFGYFESDEEHKALLKEWRRVLKPRGRLLIDYLNREHVISTLQPESSNENESFYTEQKREISSDRLRVNKSVYIRNKETGEETNYVESVRMFSLDELENLFTASNFVLTETFGNFNGESFNKSSERLVMLCQAKE